MDLSAFPKLPVARDLDPGILGRLRAISDAHAKMIWGPHVAVGPPIPLADEAGRTRYVAFPYLRSAPGGIERGFPQVDELFAAIDALRRELLPDHQRSHYRERFARLSTEVRRRVGTFGTVYLSVDRDHFPIVRTSHFLHPFFLSALELQHEATKALHSASAVPASVCFLGPHEEYLAFEADSRRVLLDLSSAETKASRSPRRRAQETRPDRARAIETAWAGASGVAAGTTTALESELRLIPRHELIPVINWTYWCEPTATAMAIGFWDNYVPESEPILEYGRLTEYWFNLAPDGHNIPDLLHKLIDPATKNWRGASREEAIKSEAGYDFSLTCVQGSSSNDWGWNALKAEIDGAGRPLVWLIWPPAHAMTAFGYRITPLGKFVVVYNTWGNTREDQLDEWNYAEYGGAPATDTGVNLFAPVRSYPAEWLALVSPSAPDRLTTTVPAEIEWRVWGDAIRQVDIEASGDGGNTWFPIANRVDATEGHNYCVWQPTAPTQVGRVRVRGYAADGTYVAGDGSDDNFAVTTGPLIQEIGPITQLTVEQSLDSGPGDVFATIGEAAGRRLHLRLARGPLAPARSAELHVLLQALQSGCPVAADFVATSPSEGELVRIAERV